MAAQENQAQVVLKMQNDVEQKINSLMGAGVKFPKDYAVENQLKLAWLHLSDVTDRNGKKALEVCSSKSIAASVLQMCIEGLSVAKKQCDFIVYGTELQYQREYHGTIALAKRYGGVKEPAAQVIYDGDVFEYKVLPNGRKEITKHEQKFENVNPEKIKGAYAILTLADGTFHTEVMTIGQIKTAWNQGAMKGNSPAHKNFPDQMCMKTVIGRACKLYISTSDDAGLVDNARDVEDVDHQVEESNAIVVQNANTTVISIDEKATPIAPTEQQQQAPATLPNDECPI